MAAPATGSRLSSPGNYSLRLTAYQQMISSRRFLKMILACMCWAIANPSPPTISLVRWIPYENWEIDGHSGRSYWWHRRNRHRRTWRLQRPYIGHAIEDMTRYNNYRPIGLIAYRFRRTTMAYQSHTASCRADIIPDAPRGIPNGPDMGSWRKTGGQQWPASAGQAAIEQLVMNAVAQQQAAGDNLIFVTPLASTPYPSITGSGCETAPNGTGTADIDIAFDFTHLNRHGHSIYARRNVEAFLNMIRNIP